jgi:hypothetical protein
MEEVIFTELIKYGGAAAVIIALIFLINALKPFLLARFNNGFNKRLDDLEKRLNNDYYHDIEELRKNDLLIWKEIRDLRERVARIEAKINSR